MSAWIDTCGSAMSYLERFNARNSQSLTRGKYENKTEHEALAMGVHRMIRSPHASHSTVKTRVRCFHRVMTVFWSFWIVD